MAQCDIWLIIDDFLKTTYNSLESLFNQGGRDCGINRPYIHEYYNVSGFWHSRFNGVKNPIRRILNSLIDAINANPNQGLPDMILIVLDADVLKPTAFFKFGAIKVLGTVINYLMNQMDRTIAT